MNSADVEWGLGEGGTKEYVVEASLEGALEDSGGIEATERNPKVASSLNRVLRKSVSSGIEGEAIVVLI